jgi:hypothetical protein|tara:strand:- start:5286 stop:5615 length:330 start_codon:yes stop_codon:yes gene_type:complete
MATIANLTIDQGTTVSIVVPVKNTDGTVKDLTGYTAYSQFRKSYYSTTYTTFTATHDSAGGNITLALTATQSSAVKAGRYVYDVETLTGTTVARVQEGIITVNPEVTKV